MSTKSTLPKFFFVKRQINKIKGWELNHSPESGWPVALGFYKTMKEARQKLEEYKKEIQKGNKDG